MISRDPSEALQGLVHVFEGLGRYTDPGLPGNVMLPLITLSGYINPGLVGFNPPNLAKTQHR